MNDNNKNIPKLRFPEFTDAWEQRAFSDLVTRVSKSSEEDGLPRVEYEDIVSGQGVLNKDIFKKESNKKGIEFVVGDTLFGKLRPYLQNWLLPEFKGLAVGDWWVLRPNDIDSEFIYSLIQSSKYQIVANLSTGTKMPRSDWKVVSETKFSVPADDDEQSKIGAFFTNLDNHITLHQRKLEHLRERKKALLQKMFPKTGELYPEIRFPGFTDAWEQRKVGEIFKVTRGQVLAVIETSESKSDGKPYPVYSSQTKNNGLMGYYSDYLFDTAITWTTDGANAGTVNYRDGKFYSTNVNGVLLSDKGYANKAIAEALNLVAWKYVSRVGNPKLMNNVMSDIVISVAKSLEEQERISGFLTTLDDSITLHQRKLEHLQERKKALLQQMFI